MQLCGDAHLSNFGIYGSPERRLVFDINDFDETLPGPFEYDVKRLAASLVVAAQEQRPPRAEARGRDGGVRVYREAMAQFASMSTLDVWYAHVRGAARRGPAAGRGNLRTGKKKGKGKARGEGEGRRRRGWPRAAEAERKAREGPQPRQPAGPVEAGRAGRRPLPDRQRAAGRRAVPRAGRDVRRSVERARGVCTPVPRVPHDLQPDRRELLDRFEVVDWARKVVGVGSVGTRAFIVLLQGRDEGDPLFLQVKEATAVGPGGTTCRRAATASPASASSRASG